MGRLCKKIISLMLTITLLTNSNAVLFGQEIGSERLRVDAQMLGLRERVEAELSMVSEEELAGKEAEALRIIQSKREEIIRANEAGSRGRRVSLEEEVIKMIRVLAPFYGESKEELMKGYEDSRYFKEAGSLNKYLYERGVIIGSELLGERTAEEHGDEGVGVNRPAVGIEHRR